MKAKRIFPFVIAVFIVAIFGGTLWFLWAKSRPKPVAVETEKPKESDIIKKVVASGTIEPRKEIEIKPRVSGILRSLRVEAGQKVKRGDLLGEVQIIPDAVSLNDANLRLSSSKLALERTKRELDRALPLGDRGATAQFELDKLRSDFALAQAELRAAEMRVRLVREGAVGKAGGASASTMVESTVDGTVLAVPVKEGSSVINANSFNPGTTIAIVADMTDMVFKGRVDESEVGKLKEGMPVEITVGALEDVKFGGKLEHIAPKSQTKDGANEFEIEAAFRPTGDAVVRAGYSGNASIVLDRREKVLSVSESVLVFEKDRRFVEVEVGPQTYEKREIRVGLSDGVRIEVLSGVGKDDTVKKPKREPAPTKS